MATTNYYLININHYREGSGLTYSEPDEPQTIADTPTEAGALEVARSAYDYWSAELDDEYITVDVRGYLADDDPAVDGPRVALTWDGREHNGNN